MTQRDESDTLPWKIWPRTPEGRCSCPYCTAALAGELEPVADAPSAWARRMGATGNVYVEMRDVA